MSVFISTSPVTFFVDLNTVRDGNRIATLLTHATSVAFVIPNPGDRVDTVDEEGYRCEALVEAVTDRQIALRMDWGSRRTGRWYTADWATP
jgi:hypothetical protein